MNSPWANGAYCVLKLKGLDSVIGVSITHYTWQKTRPDDDSDKHFGWAFRKSESFIYLFYCLICYFI